MWITSKRKSVQFSPKDFKQVNMFLAREKRERSSPLSRFVDDEAFKAIMEYKEKTDVNEESLSKEAQKKLGKVGKRRKKKEAAKKGKEARRAKQEELQRAKKKAKSESRKKHKEMQDVSRLKAQYEKDAQVGDVVIPNGDVVKDFELSD